MLGALRPREPRSSGGGFGALWEWEGEWPGLHVLGSIWGGVQRLGGGVPPARRQAIGLLLEQGTESSVARGRRIAGLQG